MRDLPPIGSRVRFWGVRVGTIVDHFHDPWIRGWEACIEYGGPDFAWVTADEIEEVLP